ncbi:MAG TPA: ABC transporter substrate-binding protein [Candidatus Dormibacteraeota bacterium]|nr:ABC transporter substrate-binding protein [Candidatus Dormibacteraeota bacterium]
MSRDEGADDTGFVQFERFLEDWSRRDFLKRAGGAAAYMAFLGGATQFLEACAGGSNNATTTAKKGGHVVEGWPSDVRTFNSMLSSDTQSNLCIGLMFDGLTSQNKAGDIVPALAESWKTSADGLTYTFKLRSGLKWSDGQPITSDDVKFTYQLAYDAQYGDFASPRRGDLSKYIARIDTPDPQTAIITTTQVYAPFLGSHGNYGILPKHVLGSMTGKQLNAADFNSGPTVSNGAYKFVKYDKGSQVTMARNDNYWAGPAYLDQWIYKVVADTVAVTNQLKTGELDIGFVDAGQFDSLKTVSTVAMTEFTRPSFTFYAYQLDPSKSQLFQDKAVRQALLYALDRQSMATAIWFGHATVANSVEPPTSWTYKEKPAVVYNFDKAKAESMLDAAGWTKGSDGIRAKNGVKLKFTMITNAGAKQREASLTYMQQAWHDIGVDATPSLIQFPQLVTQIVSIRTFDVFLVGFNWSVDPDEAALFHSRNTVPGGFNGAFFKNDQVDSILDQALSTVDRAKRKQLYGQFQDLMSDLVPTPLLVFDHGIFGVNTRVQGTDFGAFSQYQLRPWHHQVWVTDGK